MFVPVEIKLIRKEPIKEVGLEVSIVKIMFQWIPKEPKTLLGIPYLMY